MKILHLIFRALILNQLPIPHEHLATKPRFSKITMRSLCKCIGIAMRSHCDTNANKEKEIKGKENKENKNTNSVNSPDGDTLIVNCFIKI